MPEEPKRVAGVPDEGAESDRAEEAGADGEKVADTATNSTVEGRSASGDESAAALDADLDALIADVKRERDEYLQIAQRARADFENYRKRAARDARDAERRGKAGLARELVPVLDNLERALKAAGIDPEAAPAEQSGEAPSEEVSAKDALARGVGLVYGELRAALARAGVETYDPTGDRFDPATSEAVSTTAVDGAESGVIVKTLEKGYRLDGQVLRAARVVVSE